MSNRTLTPWWCVALVLASLTFLAPPALAQPAAEERDPALVKLLGLGLEAKEVRIARMLHQVKVGQMTPGEFFKGLADLSAGMKEVSKVKKALTEQGGTKLAAEFLGERYTDGGSPVEEKLLKWRREQTLGAIDNVLKRFTGRSSRFSVFLAYVGKWTRQSPQALTFAGDIDFSFVSADSQLVKEMKAAFDAEIKRLTGLEPAALDSIATAHGLANLDVYIGKWGKRYAEGAWEEDSVKEIDLSSGTKKDVSPKRALIRLGLEPQVDESGPKATRPRPSSYDLDPGLSMEMVRHLQVDIVRPKIFAAQEAIVKAAKYVDRSNQGLSKTTGAQPANADLALFAAEVTRLANTSPKSLAKAILDRFTMEGFEIVLETAEGMGKAAIRVNEEIIERFHKDCLDAIWSNVEASFKHRLAELKGRVEELDKIPAEDPAVKEKVEALRKEFIDLVDMVETERLALQHDGVPIPETIGTLHGGLTALFEAFTRSYGLKLLDPEELKDKRFAEELIRSKRPSALQKATAFVMHQASKGLEKTNNILDYLDSRLLDELRGQSPDFDQFVEQARRARRDLRNPKTTAGALQNLGRIRGLGFRGIQRINVTLNNVIQSSSSGRAAMKGLILIGLVDEMPAYRDAWTNGGWEALATEFFRRRVPFGSAVENAILGNTYRAAWDVVTTLVPPLALPEAAIGITRLVADKSYAFYWDEQLKVFVDDLYASATFQLIGVTSYEDAKVGVWRLVTVKYRGQAVSVEKFIRLKREQVARMREETTKPLSERALFYGYYFGLTDWLAADRVLRENIATSDPALQFLEDKRNDPDVGPRLLEHYKDLHRARWEEVKLNFVVNMIHQLDERKAAEDALARGELPALFAELRKITTDLKIAEQVEKAMDAEWDSDNLKRLAGWLWDLKRDLFSEGAIEDEVVRAAAIVKRYLDAYREVWKARREAEAVFLRDQKPEDLGIRLLTGPEFLTGKGEEDRETALRWLERIRDVREAVEAELSKIKGEYVQKAALDTEFDRRILRGVLYYTAWRTVWSDIFRNTQKREAVDRARYHDEARKELLRQFREHYARGGEQAGLTVYLRQQVGDQRTGAPVKDARVLLRGAARQETLLVERADGKYGLDRVDPGEYLLIAQAEGFRAPDGRPQAAVGLSVPAPPPGLPPQRLERTLYLTPAYTPKLEAAFTPASEGARPQLTLRVTSPTAPFKPASFKARVDGEALHPRVTTGEGGKEITAVHEFTRSLAPGPHEAMVDVEDENGARFPLRATFEYRPAIRLVGLSLDDRGSAQPDGNATSGEVVSIALRLTSLEPSPLLNLGLTYPADDARLQPKGDRRWVIKELRPQTSVETAPLTFQVGQVVGKIETVRRDLQPDLGGKTFELPLALEVKLYPLLPLAVSLAGPVDDARRQGTPNNADGRPNAGESVRLPIKVSNTGPLAALPYRLSLTSDSPLLSLETATADGGALAGGASQELSFPARVAEEVKRATTVTLTARLVVPGSNEAGTFQIPLTLTPAPLLLSLSGVEVDDRAGSGPAALNDGNRKLGTGETADLIVKVKNHGPALKEIFFDLTSPDLSGQEISRPRVEGKALAPDADLDLFFRVQLPATYQKTTLALTLKATDALTGGTWQGQTTLPTEIRGLFQAVLTLLRTDGRPAGPGDLFPGARVRYQLAVTNLAKEKQEGAQVNLWVAGGYASVMPTTFKAEDFLPAQPRRYDGLLLIPQDFKRPEFTVQVEVRKAGYLTLAPLFAKNFEFHLGAQATTVSITPSPVGGQSREWRLAFEVKDAEGKPVDAGAVNLTTRTGKLTPAQIPLAGGKGMATWSPPAGFAGQALVWGEYTGDAVDPAQPDRRYLASQASVTLAPPAMLHQPARPVPEKVEKEVAAKIEKVDSERAPQTKAAAPSVCVQSALAALESARAAFERAKVAKTWLEDPDPFVCAAGAMWWSCMSKAQKAVFKEIDGRDPINQWGYAEAPGCSFASTTNSEYNRCAWQQYMKRLEILTERRIQACGVK